MRLALVVAALAAGIALAGVLWFATRTLRRFLADSDTQPLGPGLEATAPLPEAELANIGAQSEQISLALGDLEGTDDPRRAIMACWLRLEAASATSGIERLPTETSGEFVRKVLGGRDGAFIALDRLHDLYLRARFSAVPVGDAERDAARDTLERLRLGAGLRPQPAAASRGGIQ